MVKEINIQLLLLSALEHFLFSLKSSLKITLRLSNGRSNCMEELPIIGSIALSYKTVYDEN